MTEVPVRFQMGLIAVVASCSAEAQITESQVLGHQEVPAEVLDQGRVVYGRYCDHCHGILGDGRGPGADGQWPPPRDFRSARFKFAGIADRGLPADEELVRVIRGGLRGTYMLPWDLRDDELHAVIQYIKAFSPPEKGFRRERLEVKAPQIPTNPFLEEAARRNAIAEGKRLYHDMFQCSSCHPSYASSEELSRWEATVRSEDAGLPVPKWSPEYDTVLLPPDFARHPMRAVRLDEEGKHNPEDIYRAVAYGLQGPMPGYEHLGAENVWRVSLYVKELADTGWMGPDH